MRKVYLRIFSIGIVLMLGAIGVEKHAGEKVSAILTPLLSMFAAAALCVSYLAQQLQMKRKD